MLATYTGRELSEDVTTVGSPDNTGDGHRMAIEAGAAMRHLDVCHVRTTDNFFGPGPSRYLLHIYPLGIYFNRNFERFIDEGVEDSDTIANAIALQPGAIAGLIFDDKARRQFAKEYDAYPRREQLICTAGSIAELAGKMRLSPEGLGRLVDVFNASVKYGIASGPNLPKKRSALRIDTPPFHGFYPVRPALNHSLGGIVVDGASSQVVDANGRRIAGLFAAGTVVAGPLAGRSSSTASELQRQLSCRRQQRCRRRSCVGPVGGTTRGRRPHWCVSVLISRRAVLSRARCAAGLRRNRACSRK